MLCSLVPSAAYTITQREEERLGSIGSSLWGLLGVTCACCAATAAAASLAKAAAARPVGLLCRAFRWGAMQGGVNSIVSRRGSDSGRVTCTDIS
eukprot:4668693-Pyramimonas_sp.AAC.1